MRRYSLAVRRLVLALTCTALASLAVVASAQAIVVNDGGTDYGVALVPGTAPVGGILPGAGRPVRGSVHATDPGPVVDAAGQPAPRLRCAYRARAGASPQNNETFALTWDANHPQDYWAMTKGLVEQFLAMWPTAADSLGSPFAVTTQVHDDATHSVPVPLTGR